MFPSLSRSVRNRSVEAACLHRPAGRNRSQHRFGRQPPPSPPSGAEGWRKIVASMRVATQFRCWYPAPLRGPARHRHRRNKRPQALQWPRGTFYPRSDSCSALL